MIEERESLLKRLKDYRRTDLYPFHMPGHKRQVTEEWIKTFPNPYSIDITEIEGFDNLHHPEDILKDSMKRASAIYGSDKTYYLINGSSCGILSAVCGVVPPGGTILMSRNCHKSAYHGVILNELDAIYIYPQILAGFGLQGGLNPEDVERMLIGHPEIQAVLVVSPTYDGIVSDIESIAGIVHKYSIPLIVDEAHGAHFSFGRLGGFPTSALDLGADVVIQSLHKTLPSFTQTAVLHMKAGLVDFNRIERYLQMFQSSSPSYLLLAGIENCIFFMEKKGQRRMQEFGKKLDEVRENLMGLKKLKLFSNIGQEEGNIFDFDKSKIIISTRDTRLTGKDLSEYLRETYHLEMEMCGPDYVTAITTLMDTDDGLDRLCMAIHEIDNRILNHEKSSKATDYVFQSPEKRLVMAKALDLPLNEIEINKGEGRVSGEFIYLYPPGIPIVAPGEILKKEIIDIILEFKRMRLPIQGLDDISVNRIKVVSEKALEGKEG